jgi:diacylglycerol kinase (ATP)
VLLGRFTGLIRAVSPFIAGASGLALRRFVAWSMAGALLWATTFTLVGYGFSESFEQSGETAARLGAGGVLAVALALLAVAWVRSGGRRRGARPGQPQGHEGAERPQPGSDEPSGEHVEREVHAQVDARESHGGRDGERVRAHAGAEDRDGGGSGEGGGAVARGERGVAGDRRERGDVGVGDGWALPVEGLLQGMGDERRDAGGNGRGPEGERQAPAPEVGPEAEAHEERSLHPPGGEQHEDRREQRMLERTRGVDERMVDLEERSHPQGPPEASKVGPLLVAVNGRASGIPDPHRTGRELVAVLEELGAEADAVVTPDEESLWEVLRVAAGRDRRVVLVGGDGTMHAAANAPLTRLPELALVPSGRANNVARALGIPTARAQALAVAATSPARPVDALRVATPHRFVYAVEAVSAGFQAEARAAYRADNSADLRQGLRALLRAVRRYKPYRARLDLDTTRLRSADAAQLFLSNLPYFGFGFEVDPGADPADGRFEAILLEARSRRRLVRLLAAARRGRHLGRRGVRRVPAARARLTEPLPLVADAIPLGTTTASVSVEPARLRVASLGREGGAA